MRRQLAQLLGHLEGENLLIVVKRGHVNKSEQTLAPSSWVIFEGHLSIALLRVDNVDENIGIRIRT